jgi:hypothetical protein
LLKKSVGGGRDTASLIFAIPTLSLSCRVLLKKSVGGGRDTASLIFAIPTLSLSCRVLLKKSVGGGRDTASLIFAIPTLSLSCRVPTISAEIGKDESAKRSEKLALVLSKKGAFTLAYLTFYLYSANPT